MTKAREDEIKQLINDIEATDKASLPKAIRAGQLLLDQKNELGHRKFGPWLRENFKRTHRTANLYMELYKHRAELETVSNLTLTAALRRIRNLNAEHTSRRRRTEADSPPKSKRLSFDLTEEEDAELSERCEKLLQVLPDTTSIKDVIFAALRYVCEQEAGQ